MTKTRVEQLRDEFQTHYKAAGAIADRVEAAGRNFTDDERATVEEHMRKAKAAHTEWNKAKNDEHVLGQISELGKSIGGGAGSSGRPVSAWASKAAEILTAHGASAGQKALAGGVDVPSVLLPGVDPMPPEPTRLVDLLTNRQRISGKNYTFIRQVARANNAAPVADLAQKPVSTFTPVEVEGTAKVVAHLSEAFPIRYMDDYDSLTSWLDDEMGAGVIAAVERQCLSGDGEGENFTGLLNTSGTLAVDFTTDLLVTARKARTALEMLGERPTAWLFSPQDLETVDLMREDAGNTGGFLVGGSSPAVNNVFGNIPRISDPGLPQGVAILGDWSRARLVVREDVHLDADRSGDLFKTNAVQLRAEGRFDMAVIRPSSFAIVDFSAA